MRTAARPLVGACAVGCATAATATVTVPQAVQIVLGVLTVFLVPGFTLAFVVLPGRHGSGERLLAAVGLSVVVATCAAVLLAATGVGLSRESFGVSLGGFTIALSVWGLHRARSQPAAAVSRTAEGSPAGFRRRAATVLQAERDEPLLRQKLGSERRAADEARGKPPGLLWRLLDGVRAAFGDGAADVLDVREAREPPSGGPTRRA